MNFKFLLVQLFAIAFSMSSHAQWDWEKDKSKTESKPDVERKSGSMADYTVPSYAYDPQQLYEYILTDLQGYPNPGWQKDYAKEVSSVPEKLRKDSFLIFDWTEWENVLNEIVRDFAPKSSFNRDYSIFIVKDPSTNAGAYEGGLILVNIGLLADIETLDELRMILAHEMGHVHHHHPFLGYSEYRKMRQEQMTYAVIGGVFGGLVGSALSYSLQGMAISNFKANSRRQETQADDFAGLAMLDHNYSVENGSRIYKYFNADLERMKYRLGYDPSHANWGSTHPDPLDRYVAVNESYGKNDASRYKHPDGFIELRERARAAKLDILLEKKAYREVVDVGWHYLLKDNNNKMVKSKMLKALERMRESYQVNYFLGRVLTEGYKIDNDLQQQIADEDMSTDEAKEFARAILRMTDSKGGTPFPLNVTFAEMRHYVMADLGKASELEERFYLESRKDQRAIDEDFIRDYINDGGKYPALAKYLLDPSSTSMSQALCIPLYMEMENGKYLPVEYKDCDKQSNWEYLLKTVREDHPNVSMLTFSQTDKIDSTVARDMQAMCSLFGFKRRANTQRLNLLKVEPSVANYLIENEVRYVIFVDYVEGKTSALVQCQEVDLYRETVIQNLEFSKSKYRRDSKYIPKRIKKSYKHMKSRGKTEFKVI